MRALVSADNSEQEGRNWKKWAVSGTSKRENGIELAGGMRGLVRDT